METIFSADYWQQRYEAEQTGWDAGRVTRPIAAYFESLQDKEAKILIPGCGRGHEAAHLWQQGFRQVYICDWAAAPLADFAQRHPDFPQAQLLHRNFFELQEADFDYIVEQTFFCALPPQMRPDYAAQTAQLLKKGGQLVGLLFRFPLTEEGPPFGGSKEEYLGYFEPHFSHCKIDDCYNSIAPRQGNEYFIRLKK